jgi:hypothetical protein
MFGKKQQKRRDYQAVEIRERFERNERTGKDIYARIAALKNVAREDLAHEVFMLYREAKHQSQLIRQSIKDHAQYDLDFGGKSGGDLATYRAEDAAYALRDHVTHPQTFFSGNVRAVARRALHNPAARRGFDGCRNDPRAAP